MSEDVVEIDENSPDVIEIIELDVDDCIVINDDSESESTNKNSNLSTTNSSSSKLKTLKKVAGNTTSGSNGLQMDTSPNGTYRKVAKISENFTSDNEEYFGSILKLEFETTMKTSKYVEIKPCITSHSKFEKDEIVPSIANNSEDENNTEQNALILECDSNAIEPMIASPITVPLKDKPLISIKTSSEKSPAYTNTNESDGSNFEGNSNDSLTLESTEHSTHIERESNVDTTEPARNDKETTLNITNNIEHENNETTSTNTNNIEDENYTMQTALNPENSNTDEPSTNNSIPVHPGNTHINSKTNKGSSSSAIITPRVRSPKPNHPVAMYDYSKLKWMKPAHNLSTPPELQLVIIDRSHPNWRIGTRKWLIIEKRLLESLHSEMLRCNDNCIGRFDGAKWQRGIKIVGCHNRKTYNFIKQFILSLDTLWPGAILDAFPMTYISRKICKVFIPPPRVSTDLVLSLIKLQNPSIGTEDWEVLEERETRSGMKIWLSISEQSLEHLRKSKGEVRYGLNRIFIKPLFK